ncbi:hypothetical protein GTP81_01180 [Rugamonas sp. FT107W]|uniref:Uncharacterized protein n=1 Tax=Duganella vulcania TaxID=2692166 RepID=A0A845HCS1_9BURK|nr:hypothetical protein [Duganella vulcania]MYN15359.1 hypothetical protein [Duganella vulcania]
MMASPEQHDVDIPGSIFHDRPSVEVSAGDRLKFAKQILLGLAIISSGIIAGYACFPSNSALAQLSELVKIGALPIVTLVISFYFPNGSKK